MKLLAKGKPARDLTRAHAHVCTIYVCVCMCVVYVCIINLYI